MAENDDNHHFVRPRMLYGDWTSNVLKETASLDNEFPEQNGERGSKIPMGNTPQQGNAILIRSISRRLRRSSITETPVEGVISRRESLSLDIDVVPAQPAPSVEAGIHNGSIDTTTRHSRQSIFAENKNYIHKGIVGNPSLYSRTPGDKNEDDHLNRSIDNTNGRSRKSIFPEYKAYTCKRSVDLPTSHSGNLTSPENIQDNRKRSVDNTTRPSRSSKSAEYKSNKSHLSEDNVLRNSRNSTSAEYRDENRNKSVNIATRQSRNSKSTDHKYTDERARSITNTGSNIRINPSRRSRLFHQRDSKLLAHSRATIYDHGDILDDNLLISASKLDNTLIRLFSHTRDKNENKDLQDPGLALMPFLNYSQSDMISMDAVFWRVFPMDAAQKETLDQELPYIEVNMTSNDIMKDLYNNDILTHMDYNQLTRTEGQGDKAVTRLMVKTLQRRGDKAYPAFMEALQAHDFMQVYERLLETERSLRKGMSVDSSKTTRRDKMVNIQSLRQSSQRMTPFRIYSNERTNEMLSPPTSVISTNQQPSAINDTQPANPASPPSDHVTSLSFAFLTNEVTTFDSHVTSDQPIVDPKKLEQQLLDIMAELEALQEEVNVIKSARSLPDRRASRTEIEFVETDHNLNSQGISPDIPPQSLFDHLGLNTDNPPVVTVQDSLQKTASCLVL